ncbi:MAG: DUF3306 domain-containing protein [Pseudomonadota bacterium]
MAEGFLGRWSRRKLGVADEKDVIPAPPSVIPAKAGIQALAEQGDGPSRADETAPLDPRLRGDDENLPPAPTLDDVAALTPESDFSRFVRNEVDPQVRNAAVKKLFADPHFQIMDGMDVYIDDYSQPDPIPERMLRTLASAEFLGLFREQDTPEPDAPKARVDADDAAGQSVPQSEPTEPGSPRQDADPDLRLQQDDAPGPPGPGQGPG